MNYCSGKATDLVDATHIGASDWEFRGRLHAPLPGRATAFAGRGRRLTFNREFWERLNDWALNFNHWSDLSHPDGSASREVDWFGEVGTMACKRPTAAHNRARGIDLCQIRFGNDDRIDMNASHEGAVADQRLYLASVASLRRYFGTVLSCWYNPEHRDHLHVDDFTAVHPIRSKNRTDTTLVQAAACLLNGASLSIDGVWATETETAYLGLLRAFDLTSADPRGDVNDGILLLTHIMRAGLGNVDADAIAADVIDIHEPGLVGGISDGHPH